MKRKLILFLILSLFCTLTASAHSGKTDADGGHYYQAIVARIPH